MTSIFTYQGQTFDVDVERGLFTPELVTIPAGDFSPGGAERHSTLAKQRANKVEVESFKLGKYAVTVREWRAVMGYLTPVNFNRTTNHPVLNVTWYETQQYLEQLNKLTGNHFRLPTELEWEYAARAGRKSKYYFSEKSIGYGIEADDDPINYAKARNGSVEVGRYPPNKFGLYDMLGNAWEWVSDCADKVDDEEECFIGILRGGCWASYEDQVTLNSRDIHDRAEEGWDSFGFRIAIDL